MLQRLLSLLLVLLLLLPPGVCICRIAQAAVASPEESPSAAQAPPLCSSCSCAKHQHQVTADPASEQSAKLVPSTPADNDHIPSCPALTGSTQWKAELTPTQVIEAPAVNGMTVVQERAGLLGQTLPASASVPICGQPLYLTLQSFQI